jgi:hypothetical protein
MPADKLNEQKTKKTFLLFWQTSSPHVYDIFKGYKSSRPKGSVRGQLHQKQKNKKTPHTQLSKLYHLKTAKSMKIMTQQMKLMQQ